MKFFHNSVLLCLLVICTACSNDKTEDKSTNLIPLPNNVDVNSNGTFVFDNSVSIAISNNSDVQLQKIADHVIKNVNDILAVELLQVDVNSANSADKSIVLELNTQSGAFESYQLSIAENEIKLSANSHHGLFNAAQTLRQLLFIEKSNAGLSSIEINDQPLLGYRGLMLDVSRHFFNVEQIKKTLDLMALYKLNTFHWHLTDDQGWRIEINQYPLLTSIGSYRQQTMVDKNFNPYVGDNTPHYGFYTQEEIRDVVEYAKDRYITIIPEIDMPGHMSAALAAYPELACSGDTFVVPTYWGIFDDILCPSETTFEFVEGVLLEVIDLFPSEYIHIGGDEVPTVQWQNSDLVQKLIANENLASVDEVQGYFYERVSHFLAEHGRKSIGWDEIQEKGLNNKTTVMVWRDIENTKVAIENGHQVILTPADFTYLNYYQGDQSTEPLAQCCMVTLEKIYEFSPLLEGLTEEQRALVLGAQGSMWTEYINSNGHLEYMLLPRLMALSEVLWTYTENKSWDGFSPKLPLHTQYLESLSYNFRKLED